MILSISPPVMKFDTNRLVGFVKVYGRETDQGAGNYFRPSLNPQLILRIKKEYVISIHPNFSHDYSLDSGCS